MATRQQFCDAMLEVFKGHGVYIGGANGEKTESLTIGKIRELEEGYEGRDHASDINRDLTFIGKCYKASYSMKGSYSGDCSGQIVGCMRRLGIIKQTADYRARDFQRLSTPVPLSDLQPADLVFDKSSNAGHVGVFVGGSEKYVIESKGRDVGVVKKKLSAGSWVIGGRLDWFDNDIPVLTRNLKYIKDSLMRGEDVKELQEQLNKKGYNAGVEDGIFGLQTQEAVIAFQTAHSEDKIDPLEVDGVVGQKTWAKLWE